MNNVNVKKQPKKWFEKYRLICEDQIYWAKVAEQLLM